MPEEANKMDKGPVLGVRHVQVVMLFFAMVICFTMRVNISMAIVAMTDTSSAGEGVFDWNMQIQSVILSSFFWGYIVLQIPSGELAARYGGMILVTICIAVNSAVSLLIPIATYYGGWQMLCGCRVLQGLSQGCLYPTMHNLIGKWVPLEEKSRLGTLIYGGAQLGTVIQLVVSGFIANSWGWPAIFYVNGATGAIWVVAYVFLGSDSPQRSKMIGDTERLYIQTSLGQVGEQKRLPTPWKKISTNLSFISLIVVHCGHNWGFWTLMTEMPSYMKQVLGVDIKANGLMSALPYLAMYMLSFPFGFLSDYILEKKWLSISTCRKLSSSIGEYGPGLALIALCYVPAGDVMLAVTLLTVVVGLNAGHMTGYLLVHIDMAPNFAGTMMGITNFFANIIGIIAPLVAGAILQDETDPTQWHQVFYVSSAIYIATNTFFVVFGTSERQSWNEPENSQITADKIFGIRHLQVLLLFFALVLGFAMRVNISMAIVAMTDKRSEDPFDWSMQTQSVVFSSFFWGYIVLQIPSGELAARYGGMILITLAIAVNSAVSLAIPYGAYHGGWQGLCLLRGIQGLSQGCLFPTTHHLIGKWVPLEEKSRFGTLIYGGTLLGTGIQMVASGYIAEYWGWPAIFYINGMLAAVWVMFYIFLGADSPQKSKIISTEERMYIQTSLGQTDGQKILKTPWKKLATSVPFISLTVMHSGHNWGFWTLMTEMPSYMKLVLGVDIKESGAMSALPYFVMYILSFPCGFISDYGLKNNWFSINTCRKVSNSIVGEYGPALALIALCHAPAGDVTQAVGLLTLVVGLNAGHLSGFMLVHIDMAPNFAGTMMGITTFFANVVSIIAPLVAGIILEDEYDFDQWRLVFYVTSGIYMVTNTIFIIFGTSARQPWNEAPDADDAETRPNPEVVENKSDN
ncbi:unnamed protein product [Spodoptera littoralis]|uniref:Putative inorganic phosphate cotransporter n=1 Tax=Spodoptera littoralis TaxID=7109 RepID=A0A9P0HYU1_SPOLI|nr:unnamed protein product [Spodoptera littoralis]CAH1638002.1 unnamed protein product [Spodoptera littoralis]